jgi:pimeloyl-ACP methyl ester carboxylesterase/DNA-binding CsgD family transcriptional regulator
VSQQVRFCKSADGTTIAYAISGKGPPLVMSTTWVTHLEHSVESLTWKSWLESLNREYTLIRYDMRGCGLSDREAGDFCFQRWVEDLEAVVDAAGVERFALLGVCSGGPTALAYAAAHPQRVSELVLYGTYARGRFRRDTDQVEKGKVLLDMMRLGWAQENHPFLQGWASAFQPGGTKEHLRSWCALQRASTRAETATSLLRTASDLDLSTVTSRVRCPMLVVHVERDAVAPAVEGRLLASLLADARFVQLDSDNHILLGDEPAWARFLAEMRAFLHRGGEPAVPVPAEGELNDRHVTSLTRRERATLELIARGLSNERIASELSLSEKTVRNYVSRILDKLGVASRAEAIVLARESGYGRGASPANRDVRP